MLHMPRNKLCVEPLFDPDMSAGGIIIPDEAKHRCNQGIVKYIGESVRLVVPGDHVLFSGYDGSTVILQGEGNLIFLLEEQVACIITDEPLVVAGLYHKDHDGNYFPATLESVIPSLTRTIEAQEWYKRDMVNKMRRKHDDRYKEFHGL